MEHKETIEKYSGSIEELANDIGDLDYAILADFFIALGNKIFNDAANDSINGRRKLADMLFDLRTDINSCFTQASEIALFCDPYNHKKNYGKMKKLIADCDETIIYELEEKNEKTADVSM